MRPAPLLRGKGHSLVYVKEEVTANSLLWGTTDTSGHDPTRPKTPSYYRSTGSSANCGRSSEMMNHGALLAT
jgi:hypothetical protein